MATHTPGFELYVWQPIPGAPSLDAECIAVIAFLTRILPRDAGLSIITTHDASVSPSRTLPCLRRDDVCVHGSYRSFVKYFQLPGQGLDQGLSAAQQAEALALSCHVQSAALALVDYHLYANAENYAEAIHRAHAKYLPWPFGWLYPLHRFRKAERRATAIGLADQPPVLKGDTAASGADAPTAGAQMEGSANPSLLFARSQKAQKRLKEQVGAARFRLESAVDALCEPLDEQLGKSRGACLLDGSIRSIDCHAYGYLALLLHARVPDTTAPDMLQKRWPRVARHVERLATQLRRPQIDKLSSGPQDMNTHDSLCLSVQAPPTILKRASVFLTALANLIMPSHTLTQLQYAVRTLPLMAPLLAIGLLGASTSIATLAYAAHTLLAKKIPRDALSQREYVFSRPKAGLGAMGASGAALAALLGPPSGTYVSGSPMQQQRTESGVRISEQAARIEPQGVEFAEVDVEVDKA